MLTSSRPILPFFLALMLASLAAGCFKPPRTPVTMDDLPLKIATVTGMPDDPLAQQEVTYLVTQKQNYDAFFKSSAQMKAGFIVSTALSESLTKNLKGFARDYASAKQMDESVKEVVGDTPPDQLSEDQSVELLRLKTKRNELSAEEARFIANGAANSAMVTGYLAKVSDDAQALTRTGTELSKSVLDDFKGLEARKAPAVTEAVQDSLKTLSDAPGEATKLTKNLTRLAAGLGSLQ